MARLEQYMFDESSFTPGFEGDFIVMYNKNNDMMFDSLVTDYVDQRGTFIRRTGRAVLSNADFIVKMSSKDDGGFLTLSYPDDVRQLDA